MTRLPFDGVDPTRGPTASQGAGISGGDVAQDALLVVAGVRAFEAGPGS